MRASQSTYRVKSVVTGGAGFIGSHLVDALLADGHDVVVIDNESATSNNEFYWNDDAANYKHDIVDYSSIRPLFDGADYVFHLAAESRLQPAILNPVEAVQKNTLGTAVVLQCAREALVKRFVYSSTSSGYGMNAPPNNETQPDDCLNPYSLSKVSGEKLCALFNTLYGLKAIALRYFNVYGERSPTGGQYAPVIGIFLEQFRRGESLTVIGDGSQRRDFVHVGDVVSANILAATTPLEDRWFGTFFNVASGKNVAIVDLAHLISEDIRFIDPRPGEAKTTLGSIERISDALGWSPTRDVEQWVADAKNALRAQCI